MSMKRGNLKTMSVRIREERTTMNNWFDLYPKMGWDEATGCHPSSAQTFTRWLTIEPYRKGLFSGIHICQCS